jgi:site-specific DNA-methyltransferase (adenine-specific)
MIPRNKILLGDCLDVMRAMPDKCIDLVLTDPPYGKGHKDYDTSLRYGGRWDKYKNGKALKEVARTGGTWAGKYKKKIADWDEAPAQEVFNELFRVSKHQIIWGGNYFNLPPTRCFNVWRKLTISEGFTMAMCEYAWCSFNSNAKIFEFAPQDPSRFHPTQKPVGLIMRQLEEYATPGMLIFDPFSGSGTTAIACHNLGLDFLCVEKDPDYHAASVARLEKHRAQMLLPLGSPPTTEQGEFLW